MLIAVLFSRQFYFSFSHNLEYFSQIGSLPLLLPPPPLSLSLSILMAIFQVNLD